MYGTICYIYITPVLKSCCERHGYRQLADKGYKIEIFDISPIVNRVAYNHVKKNLIDDPAFPVRQFFKEEDAVHAIQKMRGNNVLAIPYFDFNLDYYFIYKELSKSKIDFGFLHRVNSEAKMPKMEKSRIMNYFKTVNAHKILNSILIRIPKKLLPIKKAKFMVFGGLENKEQYKRLNLADETTKEIMIHALNFEDCISVGDENTYNGKPYAVFLDQYMPYHPDHVELGIDIDAVRYYDELNRLFDKMETLYGMEVIIAAHPKADYGKYSNAFPKRKKIKFETAFLVKNCELVIANFSTAISYGAFFKKKILVCDSDCFHPYDYFMRRIGYWSKELAIRPINLSESYQKPLKEFIERGIDLEAYKKCIRDTMKGNFEWNQESHGHFWDIFEQEVLKNIDTKE